MTNQPPKGHLTIAQAFSAIKPQLPPPSSSALVTTEQKEKELEVIQIEDNSRQEVQSDVERQSTSLITPKGTAAAKTFNEFATPPAPDTPGNLSISPSVAIQQDSSSQIDPEQGASKSEPPAPSASSSSSSNQSFGGPSTSTKPSRPKKRVTPQVISTLPPPAVGSSSSQAPCAATQSSTVVNLASTTENQP